MESVLKKYVNISLLNLCIVALYGTIMRYKIGFEFPYFDQKFLQEGHSHFAFAGWITHTLMLLLTNVMAQSYPYFKISKYLKLLNINLISAYGMLLSFSMQGYGPLSVFFSGSSIIVSFVFAYFFISDQKKNSKKIPGSHWFSAAVFFNVISSAGTLVLAYMMSTKNLHQNIYLSSVYYYLHFQYNGWFFFGCAGLFFNKLKILIPEFIEDKQIFTLFAASCIPAYFLSTLWLNLPVWLYILVIIAACLQVIAWGKLIINLKKYTPELKTKLNNFILYLIIFVAVATSTKLILQLFSTIPFISKLAFGFRTIVIAYLHLVLLAMISVFLLSYLYHSKFISNKRAARLALVIFTLGIFLNELILLVQGVASFSYTLIPYGNEALFGVALILFTGIILLIKSNLKTESRNQQL